MKRYLQKIDTESGCRLFSALIAMIGALTAYLLTLEPDASYWDCPEYLVTAIRLEVGHPPGNPVWTLTERVLSLFGGGDPQAMSIVVNASSALFTALATGMLAAVIYILSGRLCHGEESGGGSLRRWLRVAASSGGALCFGWADSPWFSAVEAEVYAMSLFLTALCVRLMVGWWDAPPAKRDSRILILIVYLTGLSIGVHQLNLLVIPALGLIWWFGRNPGRRGGWKIAGVLAGSCAAVGIILLLMMPGMIDGASAVEIYCVNRLKMPYHSGAWIFWGGVILICWGVALSSGGARRRVQMLAWIPAMLLTGYASYMIIPMRSAARPAMNEGAPENVVALAGYLGRDQYGSTPLFYGKTPYSKSLREERIKEDGSPDYTHIATTEGRGQYAATDTGYVKYENLRRPVMQPEMDMWFPRMTSSDPSDISAYADWAGMTSVTMEEVEVSYALDSLGNPVGRLLSDGTRMKEMELRPTYLQQLRYMLTYQIGYMYFRYMLWNLSGRQNDRFAVGEVEHGNFITGIAAVDNLMLGNQARMPAEIGKDNPGRNVYFLLPLLTGLLGIWWLQRKGRGGRRWNFVILVLFLMTGLAIVFYVNQSPREPRERDYSYLGSLWAYAIWIGAGMLAIVNGVLHLRNHRGKKIMGKIAVVCGVAYCIALPGWMLSQNYDDHDRSGRRGVTDYAENLLESLEPNAILFTNGDNFTFPLWWAQEVVGVRRDVTIINTAYLTTGWYVRQLMMDGEGRKGLRMQADDTTFKFGNFKYSFYQKVGENPTASDSLGRVGAVEALRRLYSAQATSLPGMLGIANPEGGDSLIVRTSAVASGASSINLRNLAALDIIATNAAAGDAARPVYWISSMAGSDYAGMLPFTQRGLFTRRLVYTSGELSDSRMEALLDFDMGKAKKVKSGRIASRERRKVYADDTYGRMMTAQRLGLLRLGGRLLRAERYEEALTLASLIERQFPASIWEYQIFGEVDSVCNEGIDLARLYLDGAAGMHQKSGGDYSKEYARGLRLLEREQERIAEWKKYRETLPPRLRRVMSPKNTRKALILPGYIDSLYNQYSDPSQPSPQGRPSSRVKTKSINSSTI